MNFLKKNALFVAASSSIAMIFLDQSSIGVILPGIKNSLESSDNILHWVVSIYTLMLSAFVLFGGRLIDFIGVKKVFILGSSLFLLSSIVCAVSFSSEIILIGRAIQGIGASFLIPSGLVLINIGFPKNESGKALGSAVSIGAIFFVSGPFVGGILSEYFSWRYLFLINIPISFIAILCVSFLNYKYNLKKNWRELDLGGLAAFIFTICSITVALMWLPVFGWKNWVFILPAIGFLFGLVILVFLEKNKNNPFVNISLFRNRYYLGGNIILFCVQICVISVVFWAIWLQRVMLFTPATAGIALLPGFLPAVFLSRFAGKWLDAKGPRLSICLGTGLIVVSMFWISIYSHTENYPVIFIGMLGYGIGAAITIPNTATTILTSVNKSYKGVASGTFNSSRQLGSTIGIAVIGGSISMHFNVKNALEATAYTQAFSFGMEIAAFFGVIAFCSAFYFFRRET